MKKTLLVAAVFFSGQLIAQDAKMNAFITGLMSKMTLEEKIGQLNLITPGSGIPTGSVVSTDVEGKIKSGKVGGMFGVIGAEKVRQAQDMAVNSTRLKIPLMFGSDVIHGHKTIFPIPLGISCSWDTALIRQSAIVAAEEATADGLNWVFSPMVDVARDPRWGRVSEGSGEDPFLGAQIATAMVKGYQGTSLSDKKTVLACVKHFALYGAPEGGRDYNSVDINRTRMFNDYLAPYKAAVDAGVASVMTSFNDIDGVPATGNKWLLTDLLRRDWKFNGMIVSDYTSVNEMVNHRLGNLQEVSAQSIRAGLDMDMVGEGFLTTLKKSLDEKKITLADIDRACRKVLEAKYKAGLFEDPYRYIDENRKNEILTQSKRDFARMIAAQSFVLLKNNANALPIKKTQRIALVGPLANDRSNMLGTWAVSGDPQLSVSVMEGLLKQTASAVNIAYAKGANITDDPSLAKQANVFGMRAEIDERTPAAMLEEAVAIARSSDVVVVVVGEASEMSGEAASRSDITLPASQVRLIHALYATGKPVVVLIMSGRPLALTNIVDGASAILHTWHAGIEAGNAIADAVYGAVNPSGKLSMSFPYSVGQVPVYYAQKTTGRPMDPNNKFSTKYMDVPNGPLFPFGHGLSYTQFTYSDVQLSASSMTAAGAITASVTVTNSGFRDGAEVVQLYIEDKVRSITPPSKELKGFQKIMLKAGESRTVRFTIDASVLKFWNADMKFVAEPGAFGVGIGGSSADLKTALFTLTK